LYALWRRSLGKLGLDPDVHWDARELTNNSIVKKGTHAGWRDLGFSYAPAACSFVRLTAMGARLHSPFILAIPLSMNCMKPIARMIWPKIGSQIR
jgi:hypothetical protein